VVFLELVKSPARLAGFEIIVDHWRSLTIISYELPFSGQYRAPGE
jgi:hypothetical protein